MSRAVIIRRVLLAIPTMIGASLVLFLLLFVGPDPLRQLQQEGTLDANDVERLTQAYGWDRPWYEQYGSWVGDVLSGDWGTSIRTGLDAWEMIADRLPISIMLGLTSLALALAVALPLAVAMAQRRGTRPDVVAGVLTIGLAALPGFLLMVLLQLGAVWLKDVSGATVFHVTGAHRGDGVVELLRRYALPVIALAAVQVGAWFKLARGELLEAIGRDFVIAALAKGLPTRIVLVRHALRSALAPIVTMVALDCAFVISGAVVVETVFGIPGMGTLLLDSVQGRDTVVALDIMVIAAAAIVAVTVLADLLVAALDPRSSEASAR